MSTALILGLVGGLLMLAFLANRVFRVTRVPDVLVLMALGLVVGPVLGLVNPAHLSSTTNVLGTLAIILVLFEGGLEMDLRRTLRHFAGSLVLSVLAYGFSIALVGLIVHKGLGMPLTTALAVGAVLGCTSSTVVLPVLQQLGAREPVRVTLMLEASWGDVLAVLTVGLLLGVGSQGGAVARHLLQAVLTQVGVAVVFATATGILWSRLLPVLSDARFWQVMTFSIVLVLYAGTEALGASGLIAVLAFGLTLANFPGMDPRLRLAEEEAVSLQSQESLLSFHSELAFLVRSFFFVLIGAIADLGSFRGHSILIAGTLGGLFLARLLAIQVSRWAFKDVSSKERELMLWIMPRGLITVVLALQVAAARSEVNFLSALAFAVILVTNVMVVIGSLRASRGAVVPQEPVATADSMGASQDEITETQPGNAPVVPAATPAAAPSKRWILDAALLVLLGLGACIVWYGNEPPEQRPRSLQHWMQLHLHRPH
ncbi:MAG: cation:proton antiporter [Candidatus Sulfotelmatobacter sp.]|jgi:cell volume regulation protein A